MPFLWNCWSHGSLGSLRSLKQLSPGFTEAQQESEEKGVSWGLLCPQAHRAQESCAGKGAVRSCENQARGTPSPSETVAV